MNDDIPRMDYDRLSVLTGGLLLALTLSRFLESPTRPLVSATVLGSPLGVVISASGLMLLLNLGMTITAVTSLLKGHPGAEGERSHQFIYWLVPALLNLALAIWLSRIENARIWSAGLLLAALIIPSAMIVEYRAIGRDDRDSRGLPWGQMALIYLAAAILFTQIFDARIRSLLSATAVGLIAAALSTRLFWAQTNNLSRAFKYSGIVGLILGQMTWGLNYMRLSGIQGGLLLLLLFHVVAGLIQQWLRGQLDGSGAGQRALIEYGAVVVITLTVIAFAAS